jgi:hypothetical protein
MRKEIRLWVYNYNFDVTRVVTIIPDRSWGGEGSLGCGVAHGLLHRIPAPLNEGPSSPGDVLYNSEDSPPPPSQFITPAERAVAKPTTQRDRHERHRRSSNVKDRAAVAELMREGEEKSKEKDEDKIPTKTMATRVSKNAQPVEREHGMAQQSILASQDSLDDEFEEQKL